MKPKKLTRLARTLPVPLLVLSVFVMGAVLLRAKTDPVLTASASALDGAIVSPSNVSSSDTVSASDLLLPQMLLKAVPRIMLLGSAPSDLGRQQIEFYTSASVGDTITITTKSAASYVYIDPGNVDDGGDYIKIKGNQWGNLITTTITVAGERIRIFSSSDITSFIAIKLISKTRSRT